MWCWPRPFRDNLSLAGWDMLWLTYPPNVKSLFSAVTEIWNALKMHKMGVVRGHRQCWQSAHNFLFVFNRNYVSILYRFRDTASYLSKFANFDLLHQHLAPPLGVTPVEFLKDFWHQKLESGLAILVENRLVTDRHTQTDRQTDGHTTMAYTTHSIARVVKIMIDYFILDPTQPPESM